MTSTARAAVWITAVLFAFLTILGYSTVVAEENRNNFQVQCVEAGGSVEDGDCVSRPLIIREP